MTIRLDLNATYDGMDVVEAVKQIMELQKQGCPDDLINEVLENSKDSKGGESDE